MEFQNQFLKHRFSKTMQMQYKNQKAYFLQHIKIPQKINDKFQILRKIKKYMKGSKKLYLCLNFQVFHLHL